MEEYIVQDGNVYRKIDAEGIIRDIDARIAALQAQRDAVAPKVEEVNQEKVKLEEAK